MPEAVIVSTARTPIGKAYRGYLNNTHGSDIGAHAVSHAVARAGIDPSQIEDIIFGAGKLGAALAQYRGFKERGFRVSSVYDVNPARIGTSLAGLIVRDQAGLEADIAKHPPEIALLTVPAEAAQGVADRLVKAGVRAILNFAPVPLQVPAHVTLRSVNMALELEILSYALVNQED